MSKPPRRGSVLQLVPIKLSPRPLGPPSTLLGGENVLLKKWEKEVRGEWLLQYLEQLKQVAEIAEISVGELLDNEALRLFAEKTYGLGVTQAKSKAGRKTIWTDARLLHLWHWVDERKANGITWALSSYHRSFESDCSDWRSLNTVYYKQALGSPFVTFARNLQADSRVANMVSEWVVLVSQNQDWPKEIKKEL